jgi:fructokinase
MTAGLDHVVVTGEALVDLVVAADHRLDAHPGGGPYNVARTIGRLGEPVAYLGRISTDGFGRRLRDELADDGVGLDALISTDAPTTLALVELDDAGVAQYRFYAEGTSAPGLELDEATAALPERVGALYVGTLGLVLEPMASTLEALVERAGQETLVALDPNCRPAMMPDPEGFRARLRRLLARTDVLKASEEDLAWLDPDAEPVQAARNLLGHERAVALVTLGGAGAIVVTATEGIEVPAPRVEVVDTIGAGDAFIGSFLAHLRAHGLGRADLGRVDEVERAAAFAARVASATCARAGANPPRRGEPLPR